MPQKLETLQTYFEDIWVKGDLTAIPRVMAPDARTRGIMGDMPFDADDFTELVSMVRELLGPIQVSYPIVVEQDDWLSALVEIKSQSAETGAPVHVFNQIIARFEGGQMVQINSGVDSLSLFEQLGLLPEDAMAIMLSGNRLN
ncbi:nuclear transport factor 2 family protein [uncultured Tateyamaria sp.]|uniref:nuclear transport factor 2 family protein n=1 Tax=uncultured Tateyamaria sp. TaxID=455651 RepID=UPI00260D52AA|nr:nuclear transport factor 2 family protein [uncultured Tateyamaria sp.]